MNSIKRTIEGIEKSPTEYKVHLDGDIVAVGNVFQTFRFLHIRHYRAQTYPLDGMCYHPNHLKDLVKSLRKKQQEEYTNDRKYFGDMIKNGVTIEWKENDI